MISFLELCAILVCLGVAPFNCDSYELPSPRKGVYDVPVDNYRHRWNDYLQDVQDRLEKGDN